MFKITEDVNDNALLITAQDIWADAKTAGQVAVEAKRLIKIAYHRESSFFNRRSSKFIKGGLFYILGYRFDAKKNQRQIADKLGTTDNTIRSSYNQWIETFPDMFADVVVRFSPTKNFKVALHLS